jgi:simple sugar transport system permease protein
MQVEEKPPPPPEPPEPEVEEAAARLPWGQRLRGWGLQLLAPAVSLLIAAIIGILVILVVQQSWSDVTAVGRSMWSYGLFNRNSVAFIFGRATPLIFAGLAVAIAFKAGLFNIGVEGQLYLGGFAAALAGVSLGSLPAPLLLPLAVLAAALAGGAWAGIAGALKARFGAHEVINTIMLNFIAFSLVAYAGRWVFQPATVRTAEIGAGAVFPRFADFLPALRGSPANLSLVVAGLAVAGTAWFLFRTRRGYELRAVGLNPLAAEYGGISVGGTQLLAMTLSGALAGVGGVNYVLGYKHWFEQGFSAGSGFLGIAVALIGRNHPVGVVAAALFFGALSYAGFVIHQRVPRELVEVLQGLVILCAIASQQVLERLAKRVR